MSHSILLYIQSRLPNVSLCYVTLSLRITFYPGLPVPDQRPWNGTPDNDLINVPRLLPPCFRLALYAKYQPLHEMCKITLLLEGIICVLNQNGFKWIYKTMKIVNSIRSMWCLEAFETRNSSLQSCWKYGVGKAQIKTLQKCFSEVLSDIEKLSM